MTEDIILFPLDMSEHLSCKLPFVYECLQDVRKAKGVKRKLRWDQVADIIYRTPNKDHSIEAEKFRQFWLYERGANKELKLIPRAYWNWLKKAPDVNPRRNEPHQFPDWSLEDVQKALYIAKHSDPPESQEWIDKLHDEVERRKDLSKFRKVHK